jgi:hypothetical protein
VRLWPSDDGLQAAYVARPACYPSAILSARAPSAPPLHHLQSISGGDVPQSEKVRIRLQALDERLARLRMEKNRLIARVSQTERKRDTRRKILIGGAVLAAIDHEGIPSLRSIAELLNWLDGRLMRPHDRAVFDLTPHETT